MFTSTPKRDRLVRLLHDAADELDIDFREGATAMRRLSDWIGEVTGTGEDGALHVSTALLCVDDSDTPDVEGSR